MQYTVRSDHFRSEVTRRYSDFQALADLLLYRCWVWWVWAVGAVNQHSRSFTVPG